MINIFYSYSLVNLEGENCRVFSMKNEISFNIDDFLIQRFEESWRLLGEDSLNEEMNIHMQQHVYIKRKFPLVGGCA